MLDERLVRLSDVPKLKLMPRGRGRKRLHLATVYRWAQRGIKGVRLETLQVGGSRCTSVEALVRFFERLSQPLNPNPTSSPLGARRRAIDAAAADAEAILRLDLREG